MAHTRAYREILEQSRRHWRIIALAAGAIGLVAVAIVLASPPAPQPAVAAAPVRPTERIQVEVLNGTRRRGAARPAPRLLRSQGFDVVFLGNADSLSRLTQVLARRGNPDRARSGSAGPGGGEGGGGIDTLRRGDRRVF